MTVSLHPSHSSHLTCVGTSSIQCLPRDVLALILIKCLAHSETSRVCKSWRLIYRTLEAQDSLKDINALARKLLLNVQKGKLAFLNSRISFLNLELAKQDSHNLLSKILQFSVASESFELAKLQYASPECPSTVKLALATLTLDGNIFSKKELPNSLSGGFQGNTSNLDFNKLNYPSTEVLAQIHVSSANTFAINEIVVIELNTLSITARKRTFVYGKILSTEPEYSVLVRHSVTQSATSVMLGKIPSNLLL